jgi:hypothetical protein
MGYELGRTVMIGADTAESARASRLVPCGVTENMGFCDKRDPRPGYNARWKDCRNSQGCQACCGGRGTRREGRRHAPVEASRGQSLLFFFLLFFLPLGHSCMRDAPEQGG